MNDKPIEGFCPSCGEPAVDGKIKHDPLCPFDGDELQPEDACGTK